MSKAVVKFKEQALAQRDELSTNDVIAQVQKIAQIKSAVMVKDEHYGRIPGTAKDTLYKAGAEKLAMTFRFAPKFNITMTPLNHGEHREYSCVCVLNHITSGNFLAEGVGSCSTMESKYRWRKADPDPIGPVPKEYWKEQNAAKKLDLIGGRGFGVKKIGVEWMVVKYGEGRVEHDNPADYYNTCLKMAKKRAFVDAVITATGGSDLFTQDVEDFTENGYHEPTPPIEKKKSEKTELRGAPIDTKVGRVDDMPEPPSESEPTQTAAGSDSPAPALSHDPKVTLIEWRDEARRLDRLADFDTAIKKLLTGERVKKLDELAKARQATVVSAMAELVRSWQK